MPATLIADVADRLFAAIEKGDAETVEALWADDVLVWKSAEPEDQAKDRALRVIAWFIGSTTTRRYQILDRRYFDDGFVQQHILHATARSGASISMRVCLVIKVGADGLIHKIDEYFDPAEIAPLLK